MMSDYIKREDAEQIMYSYGIGGTMFVDDFLKPSKSEEERQKEVWEMVRNVLDRVAVKDVAPIKHGYWQITDTYPHNVYCSECHTKYAQTHWGVWEDGSLPRRFCPNCGAIMDGDNNEID